MLGGLPYFMLITKGDALLASRGDAQMKEIKWKMKMKSFSLDKYHFD